MNKQTFLNLHSAELRRLLEEAEGDPILTPQLEERLMDAERAMDEGDGRFGMPESAQLPRTAIFLRGGGVLDSDGIRPSLAGEALIQYERMFTAQAIHDEREIAKNAGRSRRPKGTPPPGLLFTGTPRGSFGLEFVPQPTDDPALLEVRAQALGHVTEALVQVAANDSSAADGVLSQTPSSVLQPMKQFMRTLANHKAELRLAFHDRPAQSISVDQIAIAVERLDREIIQEAVEVSGVFRGVTLQSGFFDFLTDDGEVISGSVADDLSEEELVHILDLTDKPCTAEFLKTTVRPISGEPKVSAVLLSVRQGA